jgi:hypothetical protein
MPLRRGGTAALVDLRQGGAQTIDQTAHCGAIVAKLRGAGIDRTRENAHASGFKPV